jgi:5-methylcytosine-specific restriction protein A
MPSKVCNQLGCNTLVSMSERYCTEHKRNVATVKHQTYDKFSRNKEHAKFYNSKEWRETRKIVLERNGGLCVRCAQLDMITNADVVDHIVPITKDHSKRLELSNLQPLCHPCHNRKTAEDEELYGRGE